MERFTTAMIRLIVIIVILFSLGAILLGGLLLFYPDLCASFLSKTTALGLMLLGIFSLAKIVFKK